MFSIGILRYQHNFKASTMIKFSSEECSDIPSSSSLSQDPPGESSYRSSSGGVGKVSCTASNVEMAVLNWFGRVYLVLVQSTHLLQKSSWNLMSSCSSGARSGVGLENGNKFSALILVELPVLSPDSADLKQVSNIISSFLHLLRGSF